jgi:hypothetical protein
MELKPVNNLPSSVVTGEEPGVELRGHSYDDHLKIVPALLESMAACGCWVLAQRALSPTMTELCFEVQLRSVYELYSGFISAGVELSRDSHTRMTSLCTVRDHNPRQAKRRRIISVRLELSFLEQSESEFGGVAMGIA